MQEVNVSGDGWYFKPENPESFNGLIKIKREACGSGWI